jgi:hypothetical protein
LVLVEGTADLSTALRFGRDDKKVERLWTLWFVDGGGGTADPSTALGMTKGRVALLLERFRNYCGPKKFVRSGFPWKKTTKRPIVPVYTNCETALVYL